MSSRDPHDNAATIAWRRRSAELVGEVSDLLRAAPDLFTTDVARVDAETARQLGVRLGELESVASSREDGREPLLQFTGEVRERLARARRFPLTHERLVRREPVRAAIDLAYIGIARASELVLTARARHLLEPLARMDEHVAQARTVPLTDTARVDADLLREDLAEARRRTDAARFGPLLDAVGAVLPAGDGHGRLARTSWYEAYDPVYERIVTDDVS